MPPASLILLPQILLACLASAVFALLSYRVWGKTKRILVTQVVAFSPIFFAITGLFALALPPERIYFKPDDPAIVINMLLIAAGLALGALGIAYKVIHRPMPDAPASNIVGLKAVSVASAALAAMLIALAGVEVSVITGIGRSAARESSPILVAILGYFFPMAALGFARRYGTVVNRWTGGCLVMASGSLLLGFRGLLLTAVAAVVIAAVHLAESRSVQFAKGAVAVSGVGLVLLTLARPGPGGGLYQALSNRMVFTPIYQIEKTIALYEVGGAPGAWIWADIRSRIGVDVVTLQQAVWRADFPGSEFVGGSYPAVGDLAGNFGWYWWFALLLLLVPVLWWDATGIALAHRHGPLLNDLLVLIAVRVAFFGLSAAYTPLFFVAVWVLVSVRGRWERRHGELEATSAPATGSHIQLV